MTEAVYPENLSFLLSRQHRIVWFSRSSADVSVAAVSARLEWFTVRSVKKCRALERACLQNVKSTGHEEISLSSLSSSDYSELEELVNFLIDEFKGKGVNISLPSLRIDAFSLDVMSKVQDIKRAV